MIKPKIGGLRLNENIRGGSATLIEGGIWLGGVGWWMGCGRGLWAVGGWWWGVGVVGGEGCGMDEIHAVVRRAVVRLSLLNAALVCGLCLCWAGGCWCLACC